MHRTRRPFGWLLSTGAPLLALSACNAMLGMDDTELDPSKAAPGQDASSEGASGQGGAAGQAGGGGDASVEAESGGSAGAGGDAAGCDAGSEGIGSIGQACCVPSALACAGHAQKLVLYCDPTSLKWNALQSCSGKQLCSTASGTDQGSCQDPVPMCMDRSPGDTVCDGTVQVLCGPDLVTSTETPCENVCADGQCTGECKTGEKQCSGAVPQTCDDKGAWLDGAPCPYACVAGECAGVCLPSSKQCNGLVPQTCSASGEWQDGTACTSVCLAGECSGTCAPGETQCAQNVPQTCDASGTWQNGPECPFLCDFGGCTGVCVPGTKECNGATPKECTAQGAWQDQTPCTNVCVSGQCAGACTPGAKQCSNKVRQTCDGGGQWLDGPECQYVCSGGECSGVCTPGEIGCNGLVPQTCDAAGQWKAGTACPYVCTSGACTGTCAPGSKTCSGLEQQTCDAAGQWQPGAPCPFVCASGECTGVCAPGAKDCNGLVPRTCDASGQWQPGTACPYVCADGSCAGVCSPGSKDCDVLVPRECDATGHWLPAPACPYVCTAGTCSGLCSPGTKRCEGTIPQTCSSAGQWVSDPACQYACSAGVCTGLCTPGAKQCNGPVPQTCNASGVWVDGTECTGTMPVCSAGACAPCPSGYADCDANNQNGCEVKLATDPAHCGKCDIACSAINGTATCSANVCGITCTSPYLNCDGLMTNGCEVNKLTSTLHCGACGAQCAPRPNTSVQCVNGVCSYSCKTGWIDCDGAPSNGCEALPVAYVSALGKDTNAGTPTSPKQTIQAGVNAVCPTGEVRIAKGTYPITATITVQGNISLLGGYSTDFATRNLTDQTLVQANFAGTAVLLDGSGTTMNLATVVEGLTIVNPTTPTGDVMGILVKAACPIIRSNTIDAGNGSGTGYSTGIELRGPATACSPMVHSNFIDGGSASHARAILASGSNVPRLYNNTLRSAGTSYSYGIALTSGNARINNNIIFTKGAGACIFESGSTNVTELRGNLLFDCLNLYRDASYGNLTTIALVNDYTRTTQAVGTVAGNITVAGTSDVHFVSLSDLHLTTSTPLSIRNGGYDLLFYVPQDRDGDARSVPFSIGADEK